MAAEFDRHAEDYEAAVDRAIAFSGLPHDFFTAAKAGRLLELARRRLGDPARLEVLDVGCGPGLTDAFVADRVGGLHGVDVSREMVERAAAANPSATYTTFDGTRLPFPDGAVDLTFAVNVLHHVPRNDRLPLVAEMARVTKPGELVVVFEHNPWNPLTRRVVRMCSFDEDVELLPRGEARRLLEATGLRIVAAEYLLFFPSARRPLPALERRLAWLPLGAQYLVAGERAS